MTDIVIYSAVFAFGAAAGSFVNVCIYRIPRGVSVVRPRSACPACGAALGPAELAPIFSFIFLRGRCASCKGRISARYPLVEAACGAMWAAMFWKYSFSPYFICYAALCSILLAVFFIDYDTFRIPNPLVLAAVPPALAAAVVFSFFSTGPERFRSVYGSAGMAAPLLGLVPCAFFLLIYIISSVLGGGKAAIGLGDVKLLVPAGLALGLRQSLFAAFIAVTLGGLTGIALLATGRKKRKDPIPFGPFLVAGIIAALIIYI